jgi:pimeloyl-ACP methyl ester carboxylesterase
VSVAVPALLTSGELDPVTPPRFAAEAARTLPAAHVFELRGQSHGASFGPCGGALVAELLRAPGARPAASCVPGLSDTAFVIRR